MAITVGASTITMNSGSVLQDPPGAAPSFLCRAFVNFNGTGTVAIRASGNVSSITDNGVGNYTVNFTTAMPDGNYTLVTGAGGQNAGVDIQGAAKQFSNLSTSSQFACVNENGSAFVDMLIVNATFFR